MERALIFSDCALPRNGGPFEGRPYANYFLAPNYKLNDLMAAVLIAQLKKVAGYIEKKIWAARQIIEQVADIEEIMPQRVREGDRNSYWVMGMTVDTDKMECDAWEFAEALKHEGIPAGGPISARAKRGRSTATSFCPSRTAMAAATSPSTTSGTSRSTTDLPIVPTARS